MVPADFFFDPTELNRELGVTDDPDRAVLASDSDILWPLAHQLICLASGQLKALRPNSPRPPTVGPRRWDKALRAAAYNRVRVLVSAGLLVETPVEIVPHRRIDSAPPLFRWSPGDPRPDAARVAAQTREAWVQSTTGGPFPVPSSKVYGITGRGAALMGAFSGDQNEAELRRRGLVCQKLRCDRHDLKLPGGGDARCRMSVSALFLGLLARSPDLARGWRLLHRSPTEFLVPDAIVFDADGSLSHSVVFATHWCACVADQFHELCASRDMSYSVYGA